MLAQIVRSILCVVVLFALVSTVRAFNVPSDGIFGALEMGFGVAVEQTVLSHCDPGVHKIRQGPSPLTVSWKKTFIPKEEKHGVPSLSGLRWDAAIATWEDARTVLPKIGLGHIRYLELKRVPADADLSFLADAVRLECLYIDFAGRSNVTLRLPPLPSLTYVALQDAFSFADISSLRNLPNLNGLGYCGWLSDGLPLLRPTKILPQLRYLDLLFAKWGPGIENLEELVDGYLAECPNLTHLALPWGVYYQDLQLLASRGRLDSLRFLRLYGMDDVTDLKPLERTTLLQGVDLDRCDELRSLEGLLNNKNLEYLTLPCTASTGMVRSLQERGALSRLKGLRLSDIQPQGVEILRKAERLEYLGIDDVDVNPNTLDALRGLPTFLPALKTIETLQIDNILEQKTKPSPSGKKTSKNTGGECPVSSKASDTESP